MKHLVSGIAIALAVGIVAAIGAPRADAFTMQSIENANPDGTARFADPDERSPLNNPAPAGDSRDAGGVKGLNLGGTNFGLSFSNGSNANGSGSLARDPRMGLVPGDNNDGGGSRTFFGGMPDRLGPN